MTELEITHKGPAGTCYKCGCVGFLRLRSAFYENGEIIKERGLCERCYTEDRQAREDGAVCVQARRLPGSVAPEK